MTKIGDIYSYTDICANWRLVFMITKIETWGFEYFVIYDNDAFFIKMNSSCVESFSKDSSMDKLKVLIKKYDQIL